MCFPLLMMMIERTSFSLLSSRMGLIHQFLIVVTTAVTVLGASAPPVFIAEIHNPHVCTGSAGLPDCPGPIFYVAWQSNQQSLACGRTPRFMPQDSFILDGVAGKLSVQGWGTSKATLERDEGNGKKEKYADCEGPADTVLPTCPEGSFNVGTVDLVYLCHVAEGNSGGSGGWHTSHSTSKQSSHSSSSRSTSRSSSSHSTSHSSGHSTTRSTSKHTTSPTKSSTHTTSTSSSDAKKDLHSANDDVNKALGKAKQYKDSHSKSDLDDLKKLVDDAIEAAKKAGEELAKGSAEAGAVSGFEGALSTHFKSKSVSIAYTL
jgi:hypothetical protein